MTKKFSELNLVDSLEPNDEMVILDKSSWDDPNKRARLSQLGDVLEPYIETANTASESAQAYFEGVQAIANQYGYLPKIAYRAGLNITTATQVVEYNGDTYAPKLSSIPFTTSGTFESNNFEIIRGVTFGEISETSLGGFAASIGKNVIAVDSIADLLALPAGARRGDLRYLVKGYHAGTDVGGGEFYWDAASTAADNGVSVFEVSGVATGRFVRRFGSASFIKTDLGLNLEEVIDGIENDISTVSQRSNANFGFSDPGAVVSGPDETNKANPNVNDPLLPSYADQLHRLYQTGAGVLSAQNPTGLGSFAVSRKYDVVGGEIYTASIHNASIGFIFYFTGSPYISFYDELGDFHSQITGFTRKFGDREITFSVPVGASKVAFNLRNAADFSNSSPMTESAITTLSKAIMLNLGDHSLPFSYFSDGEFVPSESLFDPVNKGNLVVVKSDQDLYIRAHAQQSETKDVVWRLRYDYDIDYDQINAIAGVIDFYGIRFIDRSAVRENTVAAFNLSDLVHSGGFDECAPVRINSMYLAGGHGVVGYRAVSSDHGKGVVDVGSIWSDGTSDWVLYHVENNNNLILVRRYSGDINNWSIGTNNFSSSGLTHVSGATNTASIVIGSSAQVQFRPIIKDYLHQLRVDDASVVDNGTYSGSRVILSEVYSLINVARQQDSLIANVGSSNPEYTGEDSQIRFYFEYEWNAFGAMSVRSAHGVKNEYRRSENVDYWGAIQLQRLSLATDVPTPGMHSGVSLYIPDIAPVAGFDFQNIADVTGNSAQINVPKSSCLHPSDPASHFAMLGVNNGSVVSGHLFGYSRVEGVTKPEIRAGSVNRVLFFSSSEKQYPVAIDWAAGDANAGDVDVVTAFRAPFLPTDGDLTIPGVIVTMSGRVFIYITAHKNLSNKSVAVPNELSGMVLRIVKNHDNFMLANNFISNGQIIVSVFNGYADVVLEAS